MKKLGFLILCIFPLCAMGKLVMHTIFQNLGSAGGAATVIVSEVNMYVSRWYNGDVVIIYHSGGMQAVRYHMGSWSPASSAQIGDARRGGVLNTETMTCDGNNINSVVSPSSYIDSGQWSVLTEPSYCRDPGDGSPLVLDLLRNGVKTKGKNSFVKFDLFGDGETIKTQWLAKNTDDAFLALDINGNGIIDSGKELFGVGSDLKLTSGKAKHGFEALAEYDDLLLGGNSNGKIDVNDDIWSHLIIWNDNNANAKSDSSELKKIKETSLKEISLDFKLYDIWDGNDIYFPYWSLAYDKNNEPLDVVDVFFNTKNSEK